MPLISLDDFERDALPALTEFATIPSLSPMFDAEWATSGYLDQAAELLATWARARTFKNVEIEIRRLDGRRHGHRDPLWPP